MTSEENITLPSIFDGMNVGITLHDAETGTILDVNDRLEQLYGYSAQQLRTMTVEGYTAPTVHTGESGRANPRCSQRTSTDVRLADRTKER